MQVPVIRDDRIGRIAAISIFVFKARKFSAGTRAVIMKGHKFSEQSIIISQSIGKSAKKLN